MFKVFAFIVTVVTTFATLSDGVEALATVTLTNQTSFVKYSPISVQFLGQEPVVAVVFDFKAFPKAGRIITLNAENDEGHNFEITAALKEDQSIVVKFSDADFILKEAELNLSEPKGTVLIEYNIETKALKVLEKNSNAERTVQITDFEKQPTSLKVSVTLGDGENSITGCVIIENLKLGSKNYGEFREVESDKVLEGCQVPCFVTNCNEGVCKELFGEAFCDCRETSKTGSNCDKEMPLLSLEASDFLGFNLTGMHRPESFRFDIQTSSADGILLAVKLANFKTHELLGELKLTLQNSDVHLILGYFVDSNLGKVELNDKSYHKFILDFGYTEKQITVTIDGKSHNVKWGETKNDLEIEFHDAVYFGGSTSAVGVAGCLKKVFVNLDDVAFDYVHKIFGGFANRPLESCKTNDIVINAAKVPMPNLIKVEPVVAVDDGGETDTIMDDPIDDGYDEELQSLGTGHVKQESCDNSDMTFCKNHVGCTKSGSEPICICKKGFIGKRCQFSVLPQNCDDVWAAGYTFPGTYIIDIDGSGPMEETYAYCEKGITSITHNMPKDTVIKSRTSGDRQFRVNYKLFNKDELKALREISNSCEQIVTYQCNAAPLGLHEKKTWFSSVDGKNFSEFSDSSGTCIPTDGIYDTCKCDSQFTATDKGRLTGSHAPIISVVSLVDNPTSIGYGKMSLSAYNCSGKAGRTQPYVATFKSRTEIFPLGEWKGLNLSFEFRTYLTTATLISSLQQTLTIELNHRHLTLSLFGSTVTVSSQSRLNDGAWQRLTVEVVENSIRFSVNDFHSTGTLQSVHNDTLQISVGGGAYGYLGCIRRLIIDGQLKLMESLFPSETFKNVAIGCVNECARHECFHESRCVQKFETNEVHCVCKNNITHYGDHCEKSINDGGEISLHDLKRGFLKVKNSAPGILTQRLLFSFKTDQRDALLLYMHDQFYNFIQIHLLDYSRIVLTLNMNQATLQTCEVTGKIGKEYSRMRWVQIMLFQMADKIILNVDDEVCEISGARNLSTELIRKYVVNTDLDISDVIIPPVSPGETSNEEAFSLLFIGGVPLETYKTKLEPTYKSKLPSLLGCLRGFMVGERKIDLQNSLYWTYYPEERDAIRLGCETDCEQVENQCHNDGHCTFKWMNTDPSATLTTCDCSKTSYYGEYCEKDTGMSFGGKQVLRFRIGEVLSNVFYEWSKSLEQTFSFAFAASKANESQTLATIFFKYDRMLEVILCRNGSLNVGVVSDAATYLHTFAFNYTDGYRHFFQAAFNQKGHFIVTVDSLKYTFPTMADKLTLLNTTYFFFGGITESTLKDRYTIILTKTDVKNNYTGCISNIDINLHIGDMHFTPIRSLQSSDDYFSRYVEVFENVSSFDGCGSFKIPGAVPAKQDNVNSPEWDSPFSSEPYIRPPSHLTTTTPITVTKPSKSKSFWWIIAVIIIALLLIAIIILIILHHCKRKNNNPPGGNTYLSKANPPVQPEVKNGSSAPTQVELVPLLRDAPPERPVRIKNNYDLPVPDQVLSDIPLNNAPTNPQESSGGGVTKRQAPLAHTNETNRLSTPPYS